jgi:hypothetical protein
MGRPADPGTASTSHGGPQRLWQMCPFLSGFRQPLNCALSAALEHPSRSQQLPFQARQDLRVWAGVVTYSVTPLPIPHRPVAPSLSALHFVSDEAGARYVTVRRKRIPTETPGDRGAAAIGICQSGAIWLCARITWPTFMLLHASDEKGQA